MNCKKLTKRFSKENIKDFFQIIVLPLFAIIIFWKILANHIDSELVLPEPFAVFKRFFSLLSESVFRKHLFATIFRSLLAFSLSFAFSLSIGLLSCLNRGIENFFKLPLAIIKATPVVSLILLTLFWFKSNTVPVFIGILMTLPIMTTAIIQGFKNVDTELLEMCKAFNFTKKQIIKNLYIPSMLPYFFSGALSAFGLSWKVVVAAEILCLPKSAIGSALQTAKVHIETTDVFAITMSIILISFVLETVAATLIAKRKSRYA